MVWAEIRPASNDRLIRVVHFHIIMNRFKWCISELEFELSHF